MKIETIFALERLNTGNYCHLEMSASAKLEEGDDAVACMVTLKGLINTALLAKACVTQEIKAKVEAVSEVRNTPAEVEKVATPVKEAKKAPKKEKVAEVTAEAVEMPTNIPDVIVVKEEKKKAVKLVKYSSAIPEHKSIFGGYLSKSYGDAWKTASPVEEIKKFTASLNGQDFLNASGTMVPTFLELVHTFFGMPTNA